MSLVASKVEQSTFPGICNAILEPDVNHLATEFISNNYEQLVTSARKMGVNPEMCNDIVHDVYMSIMKSEENCESYDPNKGKVGDYISIEEFVYGRLKGYSLNRRYHGMNDEMIKSHPNYEKVLKGNKNYIVEIPSCSNSEEYADLAFYQKAYAEAPNYDDLESVDLEMSVPEELEYCLTFENSINMNIRYFLKNLTKISHMNIDVTVFSELKKMGSNTEFVDAIRTLIEYAKASPDKYEALMQNL